jgi:hypothetical protein
LAVRGFGYIGKGWSVHHLGGDDCAVALIR